LGTEEVVTGGSIFSPALATNAGVVGLEKAGPKHADNLMVLPEKQEFLGNQVGVVAYNPW
jgi:hypothetical protein